MPNVESIYNESCLNFKFNFQQFITRQRDLGKKFETEYNVPILYLTELYALVMGFSPDEVGLKFHRTRLTGILEKPGI